MSPLADTLRPQTLDDFFGQEEIVGKGKPLRKAIDSGQVFSFILWGPPGTGKTTLARIYARAIDADVFELSAVSAGKADIKKIIEKKSERRKLLFLDEIHRFNKAQQDFLLPYVESGELVLVGATTENPSFEVNSALLSRLTVFVLKPLEEKDITQIISRTDLKIDKEAQALIAAYADGDARRALGFLETVDRNHDGVVTKLEVEATLTHQPIRYDKKSEEHYDTISAFIKGMRASQPDAALYYLARMLEGGEDPKFIARRMVIFASEDIGMKQPTALVVANEVFRAVETIGMPEAGINLAHGVVYLSKAPKDKSSYYAYQEAIADVRKTGNLEIPLKIRNAPTKLMKSLGYGKDYEKYTKEDLLPEKLKGRKYWRPDTSSENSS